MKKIIYSFILCLSLVAFGSCSDDTTQDTSKVTHFVTFTLNGDKLMKIPVGSTFKDPGVVAMEGTEDVTSSMKTDGTVDGNSVGVYNLTYSAVNVDGFSSSTERTVAVYNPNVTTDIAGSYLVGKGSFRLRAGVTTAYSGYAVTLTQVAPGIFLTSDYLGGYYDQRAGYGSNYAGVGYMKLNPDNTLEALSGHFATWGDDIVGIKDGKYDPATGTVSYTVTYAGMDFTVILTK